MTSQYVSIIEILTEIGMAIVRHCFTRSTHALHTLRTLRTFVLTGDKLTRMPFCLARLFYLGNVGEKHLYMYGNIHLIALLSLFISHTFYCPW